MMSRQTHLAPLLFPGIKESLYTRILHNILLVTVFPKPGNSQFWLCRLQEMVFSLP